MRKVFGVFLFLILLVPAVQVSAQEYRAWVGASFDADPKRPNPAGHICGLFGPADARDLTITCMTAHNGVDGQPIYDISAGLAHKIGPQGRFSLYGLAQGGISQSESATTGLFNGGLASSYKIKDKWTVIGAVQGAHSPSLDGWKPRLWIGFVLKP